MEFLQKIENLDRFPSKREISRSNVRTGDNLSKREGWNIGIFPVPFHSSKLWYCIFFENWIWGKEILSFHPRIIARTIAVAPKCSVSSPLVSFTENKWVFFYVFLLDILLLGIYFIAVKLMLNPEEIPYIPVTPEIKRCSNSLLTSGAICFWKITKSVHLQFFLKISKKQLKTSLHLKKYQNTVLL